MKSSDFTPEQRKKLEGRIAGDLKYLSALLDRMAVQKFPETDPLRMKTQAAHEAMMALLIEVQKTPRPMVSYPDHEAARKAEWDEISERIAPIVAAAHKHRRWKR